MFKTFLNYTIFLIKTYIFIHGCINYSSVYNSSANLNKLSKEIRSNVKKQLNYEILLVNDFSVDDVGIFKHLSKNRNIRGINLKKIMGNILRFLLV